MHDEKSTGWLARTSIVLSLAGATASVVALVPEFGQWLFPKSASEAVNTSETEPKHQPSDTKPAPTQPIEVRPPVPEAVATLVVRRNQRFNQGGADFEVLLDGYPIDHQLKNGEMKAYSIYAGDHNLVVRSRFAWIHNTSNLVQFSLKEGQTLVLVCTAQMSFDSPILCQTQ